MIRRLLFSDVAVGQPFYASLRRLDFAFPLHCHDFWEAFLCVGGSGSHEFNGSTYPIATGDLWLIRPNDIHSVRPLHDFAFINVAWPVAEWEKWRALAALDSNALGTVVAAPHLGSLFRGMAQPLFEDAKSLELCRFWAEIALALNCGTPGQSRPDWMLRAIQALETEEGLCAGWPLLLQTAHVSPGHICRQWKKTFGQTPTAWINARRLENAARLLLQTNLSIQEISTRCGFDNTTYFYSLFGRKYGVAPRAYRLKTRP
jgi:AraC family cel operon transcriptional repressor